MQSKSYSCHILIQLEFYRNIKKNRKYKITGKSIACSTSCWMWTDRHWNGQKYDANSRLSILCYLKNRL